MNLAVLMVLAGIVGAFVVSILAIYFAARMIGSLRRKAASERWAELAARHGGALVDGRVSIDRADHALSVETKLVSHLDANAALKGPSGELHLVNPEYGLQGGAKTIVRLTLAPTSRCRLTTGKSDFVLVEEVTRDCPEVAALLPGPCLMVGPLEARVVMSGVVGDVEKLDRVVRGLVSLVEVRTARGPIVLPEAA
ncbi:MAG: hypothetical protein AB7S26_03505 [Sandaracinaceae bacterium]